MTFLLRFVYEDLDFGLNFFFIFKIMFRYLQKNIDTTIPFQISRLTALSGVLVLLGVKKEKKGGRG